MFSAFCFCSPSKLRTWKGCAAQDKDTLQGLLRAKLVDDVEDFDLTRFEDKIIGLMLCRFEFCPDPLTLLSTEQRSIRQFWDASRWGDEPLGFISVVDVCRFADPQMFWRRTVGRQIRTSFFWQLTDESLNLEAMLVGPQDVPEISRTISVATPVDLAVDHAFFLQDQRRTSMRSTARTAAWIMAITLDYRMSEAIPWRQFCTTWMCEQTRTSS